MKYFYASRFDKNGDYLVTSYTNAKTRDKYGGSDADTFDGLRGVELGETGEAVFNNEGQGHVVRSYMKARERRPRKEIIGKYVLYAQDDNDVWHRTEHVADQYGDLNKIMKEIAGEYKAVMIIEDYLHEDIPPSAAVDAPF